MLVHASTPPSPLHIVPSSTCAQPYPSPPLSQALTITSTPAEYELQHMPWPKLPPSYPLLATLSPWPPSLPPPSLPPSPPPPSSPPLAAAHRVAATLATAAFAPALANAASTSTLVSSVLAP